LEKRPLTDRRIERMREVANRRQSGLVVVLEDIGDPHNAEAVLRSCDAFGIQTACFIFERQPYFNPRRVGKSTSASANKWLDFRIHRSTRECLEELSQEGYELVATSMEPEAESIFEARLLAPKIALLAGNERAGLSETALSMAHRRLRIPMAGMVQSLNLSVSTALCLYEITRQRMPAIERYRLDEEAARKLLESFAGRD
jgi:tRNA (guanosine-2'-O-)-methyltransferase